MKVTEMGYRFEPASTGSGTPRHSNWFSPGDNGIWRGPHVNLTASRRTSLPFANYDIEFQQLSQRSEG